MQEVICHRRRDGKPEDYTNTTVKKKYSLETNPELCGSYCVMTHSKIHAGSTAHRVLCTWFYQLRKWWATPYKNQGSNANFRALKPHLFFFHMDPFSGRWTISTFSSRLGANRGKRVRHLEPMKSRDCTKGKYQRSGNQLEKKSVRAGQATQLPQWAVEATA